MDEMNKRRMRSNAFELNEQQSQLQRDLFSVTHKQMNPLFLENQSQEVDFGFVQIEDVSEQQIAADTLKINRLLDNAADLHLTAAQRKDLEIRRNRNLDFELVNDQSKTKDSDEMKAVKNDIREYEKMLYQSAKTDEERQQMIIDAMTHCKMTIADCDMYLKKGKSFFFWRQGRFDQVAEAKERFQKDFDTFLRLFEASDTMKKGFRATDRLIDLMNVEAVNERVAQQAVEEAEEDLQLDEELKRMEEEIDDREAVEEQAEGVNEFFAGAEEQAEDQLLDEELKQMSEEIDEREEGYKQAEGINDFFTSEEKRLQREEKRQSGESWAENVDDYFTEVEKKQKLDEWYRGVEDRIHWDLQMEQVAEDVNEFFEGVEEQQRQEEEARQAEEQQQIHTVSYDLDEKNSGLETQTIAAGASIVTVIKDTKTKQKVYFRQGENAGGWNSEELVKNFMESIKGEIQLNDDVKENLKKAFGDLMPQQLLDRIRKAYTEQNEKELKGGIDQLDGFGMSAYRSSNFKRNIDSFVQSANCPGLLKEVYRDATEKVRTEIGKAFTLFARKQFQWSYSVGSAGIDPEQSLTDRSVATSKLAGLLGISSMVSDSGTAVIKKDGKEITGNVTEDAGGKTIERMKGTWSYSDKAIGQAYTLQVFDMICGQIDRHHENYRVIEKNQNVDSIKAINNEMSFGNLTWEKIAAGHENISPLTESHMRAMPIAVINQILSLDEKTLRETLGDVLDGDSMSCLLDRLKGVQNSIIEYAKKADSGLQISAAGKVAAFTGEDQDDTLRMLKAVRKERAARTMIRWDNLSEKTLDEKIETRKKELAQKK